MMRTQFSLSSLALTALFLTVPTPSQGQDAKTILQQGLFAEEAEQNLDKAAASYEQVIGKYDEHRRYAVAALYRLVEVRRKLLLARGAEIKDVEGSLVEAIQNGYDPVASWLVENGTDINAKGQGFLEAIDGSTQKITDPNTDPIDAGLHPPRFGKRERASPESTSWFFRHGMGLVAPDSAPHDWRRDGFIGDCRCSEGERLPESEMGGRHPTHGPSFQTQERPWVQASIAGVE
jgi:hypothetical protein